jgi:hypothetical protein
MQSFAITPEDLVEARLYADEESVLQDALRYLFQNRPDVRVDFAVYRYEHAHSLSLAKMPPWQGSVLNA